MAEMRERRVMQRQGKEEGESALSVDSVLKSHSPSPTDTILRSSNLTMMEKGLRTP